MSWIGRTLTPKAAFEPNSDDLRGRMAEEKAGAPPIPDPTTLTTVQLEREIHHLRELIEARLDQMDRALIEARGSADQAVTEFDKGMTRRLELADANVQARFEGVAKEFVTFKLFLDVSKGQAEVALASADKAVAAAFASSREAIDKAEQFNEKRFELLIKSIDEIKLAMATTAGKGQGAAALWAYLAAAIFLAIAVVSFLSRL